MPHARILNADECEALGIDGTLRDEPCPDYPTGEHTSCCRHASCNWCGDRPADPRTVERVGEAICTRCLKLDHETNCDRDVDGDCEGLVQEGLADPCAWSDMCEVCRLDSSTFGCCEHGKCGNPDIIDAATPCVLCRPDEVSNGPAIVRGLKTLDARRRATLPPAEYDGEAPEAVFVDTIVDILHAANHFGIDVDKLLYNAHYNYDAEL